MNRFLILPMLLFSTLMLPFLSSIPYLDGNIDFVQINDFYTGGFSKYFENWRSVHPPLKLILARIYSVFGGVTASSQPVIGFLFGVLGVAAFFFLSRELFGRQIARMGAVLLAVSPLFLAAGIFCLGDYLLTILILLSLYFYSKQKHFGCAVTTSLAVLTKETGLILPVSVFVVELLYSLRGVFKRHVSVRWYKFVFFLSPFSATILWRLFLRTHHQEPWSDWIFAETASKGSLYTIVNNLVTFNFLNKYAYQHWGQLFFLNFNWVYWLLAFVGIAVFLCSPINRRRIVEDCVSGTAKAKTLLVSGLFAFGYFMSVLSFQTYTIPRYALPLIPILLMMTSFAIRVLTTKEKLLGNGIFIFLGAIIFISLFSSLDPISTKLWGKTEVLGEEIYALNQHLAGNDGITYNMQYLFIAKERTRKILEANRRGGAVVSTRCHWIFPDPRNENKMIKILKLDGLDQSSLCRPPEKK